MCKFLFLILLICHLSFAAEINISDLSKAVAEEISKSAKDDKNIAKNMKEFDKSTLKATGKLVPVNFAAITDGLYDIADEINLVIQSLNKYRYTHVKGDVYFPDKLFDSILNGFTDLVNEFRDAAEANADMEALLLKNGHRFRVKTNGDFYLPPCLGPKILQIKYDLSQIFANLQDTCDDTQAALKEASQLLISIKNKEGELLFKELVKSFKEGALEFGKVADFIEDLIEGFKQIGFSDSSGKVIISTKAVLDVFNTEMKNIGDVFYTIGNEAASFYKSL